MKRDTSTPKSIHSDVLRLCARLSSNERPVFLASLHVAEGAKPLDCFENARMRVVQSGGRVVFGWTIWEWPRALIEGEFHAVWQNPEGQLVDVTPRIDAEDRILFLPDSSRVYEELQIDNVRMSLSSDPAVADFIRAAEELFRVKNRGARAFHRNVEIPEDELMPVVMAMGSAFRRIKSNLKKR